jgi:hypothetical protein
VVVDVVLVVVIAAVVVVTEELRKYKDLEIKVSGCGKGGQKLCQLYWTLETIKKELNHSR